MYGIVHVVYLSLIAKQAMSFNSISTDVQYSTPHYTTLHYTTLHYTTLHYTTLHYTTLRYFLRLPIICTVLCVCLTFIPHVWLIFILQITEETFQTLLDRVATTKDFSTVRDNVLFFLQVSTTTTHPSLLSDLYSCTCHNNSRLIY